ncbi:MAG: hypothetical protein HC821_05785 [Lewinella sp.]|nr:hypothetical protein [Lewinella sp.]
MGTRKRFIQGLAAATVALPLGLRLLFGQGQSQNSKPRYGEAGDGRVYHWKMVTTWPKGFPILGDSCMELADLLRNISGGRLDISVLRGLGEFGPSFRGF